MFEDFISSIGNIFSGGGIKAPPTNMTYDAGNSGGTPPFVPTQDSGGIGQFLMPLLIGGGTMLASKLLGAGDQANIDKAMKSLSGGADAGRIGRRLLDRAGAGKLTDPQQATVDIMKKEQNARNQQYLASLGIPVSTANIQMQNNVDTQAEKLKNDLINTSFQQGIQALGLGNQSAAYLLQAATKSKSDLANTIGEVAKQIGMIFGPNQPQPKPVTNAVASIPAEWAPSPQYAYMDPFTE